MKPVGLPPERLARYREDLAKVRWELPGEIEAARIEIAELEGYVRKHGSPEDNRAIDTMLARLKVLSDDHFNVGPDEVDWGHVGTLAHYAELLKRITDSAFKEGEHAE